MGVRRVVTGHDAEGRSIVVADEESASLPFGPGAAHFVWGRDDAAHFPDDGSPPETATIFPPPGGCRASVLELPPGAQGDFDTAVVTALAEFADPDRPGMHRTASLDFDIVLEGTLILELDGGQTSLNPGDIVVQNGTSHRWVNPGPGVARWAAVVVGAHHDAVPG
jgi:mannose-6-phosphate isomerase-like protein (cupin superfamily)